MTTETYNGFANHATWNVALWLGNDEGMYNLARGYAEHGYKSLSHLLVELFGPETPDGVNWQSSELDIIELNEMLEDFWYTVRGSCWHSAPYVLDSEYHWNTVFCVPLVIAGGGRDIKTSNYPNLQRWQNARVISSSFQKISRI